MVKHLGRMPGAEQAFSAQSFMYLMIFSFLLYLSELGRESLTLSARSEGGGHRLNWRTRKNGGPRYDVSTRGWSGKLARLYLRIFVDEFGSYATKRVLKILASRRGTSGSLTRSRESWLRDQKLNGSAWIQTGLFFVPEASRAEGSGAGCPLAALTDAPANVAGPSRSQLAFPFFR